MKTALRKLFTTERAFTTSHAASISFMAYKHFTNEMLHGIWMQWKYLLGHFKVSERIEDKISDIVYQKPATIKL